jgi:hypothetical protein
MASSSRGRKSGVEIKKDSSLSDFSKAVFKTEFGFGDQEVSRYSLDFGTSSVVQETPADKGPRAASGRGAVAGINPKKLGFEIPNDVGNKIAKKVHSLWVGEAKKGLSGTALYDYIRAMRVEFQGQSIRISLEGWEAVSREAGWAPTPGGLAAGIGRYDGSLKDMKPMLLGSATHKVIPMRLEGTKDELIGRIMSDISSGRLATKFGSGKKAAQDVAARQVEAAYPKPVELPKPPPRDPNVKRRRIVDLSSGKVTDLGGGATTVSAKPGPAPPNPYGGRVKIAPDDRLVAGPGEDIRSSKVTAPDLFGAGSVTLKGVKVSKKGPTPETPRMLNKEGKAPITAYRRRYTKSLLEDAKVFRSPGKGHDKGRSTFIVFRTVSDGIVRVPRPKHGRVLSSRKYQEALEAAQRAKKKWLTKGRPPINLLEHMKYVAAHLIASVSMKLHASISAKMSL